MPNPIDISGEKYGRLTAIKRNGYLNGKTAWLCRCECGNEKTITLNSLRTGNTKSCGCLLLQEGKTKDRSYFVWQHMMSRCYNPKTERYPNYGGRGITVCESWHDYWNFRKWAYSSGYDPTAPTRQCTIDRIDVNGNYCPDNCKWSTSKEQSLNTTRNHRITVYGETMTLTQASEKYGIPMKTISARINKLHWNPEEAAVIPVLKGGKRNGEF